MNEEKAFKSSRPELIQGELTAFSNTSVIKPFASASELRFFIALKPSMSFPQVASDIRQLQVVVTLRRRSSESGSRRNIGFSGPKKGFKSSTSVALRYAASYLRVRSRV